jgi:predicted alpha-1,2-mannosidase
MDKKTVDFMLRISFFLSIILAVCSCHLSVIEPYECVDPFIGTAGDCGQMDPSATIPFSMIKVGPDAVKKSHVGYDYNQTAISGFSINRTSGVGCTGSGGNINIRPADNSVLLKICKNKEVAKPGLYTATLSNGVVASMTCTERIAYEEFVYPQGQDRNLFINFASTFGGIRGYEYRVSGNTIEGKISNNTTCKRGVYSFYFVVEISDSFKILSQTAEDILLQLNATENTAVTVRVAVSPISVEDCYKELQDEERTFQQVYEDARVLWTDLLGRIQVYGGTDEQRIMFYTSLYRTLLSPVNVTTSSGQFRNSKGEIQDADGFTYYSSWSIWDTYRTKFPLMVLMNLDNLSDIGNSLLVHYINGKTIWSTEHEVTPTTRTDHAPIVLLDMMAKGIKLDYLEEAYPYIVAEVESEPLNSPDQYLETAYDYWALALPLRRIIESKVSKVGSGFYGDFKEYGLYIFCKDNLTEEEVILTMEYTSDLQRHLDIKYSKMYLSLIDRLYVCDLSKVDRSLHNTTCTSYEISRKMCKELFLGSLDYRFAVREATSAATLA